MNYRQVYKSWLDDDFFDGETKEELLSIKDDDKEIEDRFYKNLDFGTAGLRGKLGAGTNRMNKYVVMRTSQGLSDTILSEGKEAAMRGVAISYDVRWYSKDFAELAARVLASNGIKVYLSDDIRPTPLLSYAIRSLKAVSGIMVTASHNPKEYNGYKVYWEEGSQILEERADQILANINKIDDYSKIKCEPLDGLIEKGLIEYFGREIDEKYFKDTLSLAINEDIDKDIRIVYSPLNGTGNKYVREILKRRSFNKVYVVKEQEDPDPDFTTLSYPNPENPDAFEYSLRLGKKVKADILIATDPDSDRFALEVFHEGEYVYLNGNEVGALLTNYILKGLSGKNLLRENDFVVKTIVTGDLSKKIAAKYDVEMIETLTGFKNIYAPANKYEKDGQKRYIFGYEESIGYSYGTFVRDKDGVSTAMMVVEMTAYYKKIGKTLVDVLNDLYNEFGYHKDSLSSIFFEGIDGEEKIARIMETFRKDTIKKIGGVKLSEVKDYYYDYEKYKTQRSNVLINYYEDGSWFALRPSGTEPKIKLYIYSFSGDEVEADDKIKNIERATKEKILSVE
ncbi:MAG: phospho-sugar mutase [Finegoldia sp.]|nr:phospho-sugar mutase [Finegoldia sp.]